MEEDIKILEERCKESKEFYEKYGDTTFTYQDIFRIQNLTKAYKELLELYKSEKTMKNQYVKLYQDILLKENVIPISLVEEKIEELKTAKEENADEIKRNLRFYSIYDSYELQINILQELLEKRK